MLSKILRILGSRQERECVVYFYVCAYPCFDIWAEWAMMPLYYFCLCTLLPFIAFFISKLKSTHGRDLAIWNMEPQSHNILAWKKKLRTAWRNSGTHSCYWAACRKRWRHLPKTPGSLLGALPAFFRASPRDISGIFSKRLYIPFAYNSTVPNSSETSFCLWCSTGIFTVKVLLQFTMGV